MIVCPMPVLDFSNIEIYYRDQSLLTIPSLAIQKGEIHGIIGESGSGKSLTLLLAMKLLPKGIHANGQCILDNQGQVLNLLQANDTIMKSIRGKTMGMIFQEPMSALNPRVRCGDQVLECLNIHQSLTKNAAKVKVIDSFRDVGLEEAERIFQSYPHQISGGQRQRVMIAMATINNPEIVLADEPTTALDPATGIQVLELLVNRCKQLGASLLLVSHDLELIAKYANTITVMRQGKIISSGSANDILKNHVHPYVSELLSANILKKESKKLGENIILELKNFGKKYSGKQGKLQLFKDLNVTLHSGETIAIVGKSGSGKSTIAKILTGLESLDEGEVWIDNQRMKPNTNNGIQMVFQDPFSSLNNEIRNLDCVREVFSFRGFSNEVATKKSKELLLSVGLDDSQMLKYPHQLSGGQRQRLCIARSLASEPKILILDESVAALDPLVRKQILLLLQKIQTDTGMAYLFITHDPMVASEFSDSVLSL